jgi:hypothetical protein
MNAVIYLHFPTGPFVSVPVDDLQRSDSIYAAARQLRGGHTQSRQMTR